MTRRFGWHGWRLDLAQTARLVAHAPLSFVITVVSLAIGLTAAVSVYSGLNSLIWGELPGIDDRRSLSTLHVGLPLGQGFSLYPALTVRQYEALRLPLPTVAGIAVEGTRPFALWLDDDVVNVLGAAVSGNYFDVLGTRPAAGRLLARTDESSAAPVAVISHRFWRDRLGSADVSGRFVRIGTVVVQVIGVAPAGFNGLEMADVERGRSGTDLWFPLSLLRDLPYAPARDDPWLTPVIRHAPGATRVMAQQQIASVAGALAQLGPAQYVDRARQIELTAFWHPRNGSTLELLGGVGAFMVAPLVVLAIGCANAVNMRLSRSTARARELAVRVALGASRWQLVRLLTIEVVLVATTALLLAWLGVRVVIAQTAPLVPLAVRPDWRVGVVAATLVAVVVAGSGLLPAWLATRRLGAGRLGADVSGSGRLRHLLVGGQVALSLFLLIAGALLTRSATVVAAAMPPVVGELIGVELDLQSAGHGAASARAFADRLVERLSLEPGVRSAALTDDSLLARRGIAYRLPGATSTWKRDGSRRVSPDWFESLDLRVVAGRSLKLEDRSASVAVVSEALARQIAPGASPVGMTLFVAGETRDTTRPIEVVGVVSDQMLRPGQAAPEPALYVPLVDVPLKLFLFVRTSDRGALLPRMRSLIAGVDPRVPWMQIEPADAILARETAWTSILAWALGALGFVALGLAMAGLYAVLAYLVSLRRREIGIRLAIGAQPAQIVRLIFGQSLRVVGGGIIVGITLAVPAALLMRALIVGVSPFDPVSIAPTVALLIIVAGLASAIPARVAARVDPTITLRDL